MLNFSTCIVFVKLRTVIPVIPVYVCYVIGYAETCQIFPLSENDFYNNYNIIYIHVYSLEEK